MFGEMGETSRICVYWFIICTAASKGVSLSPVDLKYLLQPVVLMRVGAEGTGAIWTEKRLHINYVGSFTLQGDHVIALPRQSVSWYKGSGLTLAEGPSLTG